MTNPKNEWHGGNYNDAFWNGFWKGARVGSTIVAINNIIESFAGVTKVADGHDILKNHEALKEKGVGLEGTKFNFVDYDVKNAEFAEKMMQQEGWKYEWAANGPDMVDCFGGVRYSLKEMGYNIPNINDMTLTEFASKYTTSATNAHVGTISVFDWKLEYPHVNGLGQLDHVITNITGGNIVHASSGAQVTQIYSATKFYSWATERIYYTNTLQINWDMLEKYR
jgi:aldehyde:ferredoxin oxidoreductase